MPSQGRNAPVCISQIAEAEKLASHACASLSFWNITLRSMPSCVKLRDSTAGHSPPAVLGVNANAAFLSRAADHGVSAAGCRVATSLASGVMFARRDSIPTAVRSGPRRDICWLQALISHGATKATAILAIARFHSRFIRWVALERGPSNTGDKLRSSIACAGFVCFIPLFDGLVAQGTAPCAWLPRRTVVVQLALQAHVRNGGADRVKA